MTPLCNLKLVAEGRSERRAGDVLVVDSQDDTQGEPQVCFGVFVVDPHRLLNRDSVLPQVERASDLP